MAGLWLGERGVKRGAKEATEKEREGVTRGLPVHLHLTLFPGHSSFLLAHSPARNYHLSGLPLLFRALVYSLCWFAHFSGFPPIQSDYADY